MMTHGAPDRVRNEIGGCDPQAIEMRLHRAARHRDDDVAVVSRVRRPHGVGDPVVPALCQQVALGLVHRASVATTTSVVASRRGSSGKASAPSVAVDPASTLPSASTTSPTAFTTASRADRRLAHGGDRDTETAGDSVLGAAPLPDGRAASGADASGRDRSARVGRRDCGAPFHGTGALLELSTRS